MRRDAQLRYVERQKGQNLTDGEAGKEAAKPDRDEINLPGFHNDAFSFTYADKCTG